MPISQSAFARMSAASASPRYSSLAPHRIQRVAYGVLFQGRDPQPQHRLARARVRDDAVEDALSLAVRVARVDQDVILVRLEQTRDDAVLAVRAALSVDLPLPSARRVERQGVHAPLVPAAVLVLVRREQVDEMPLGPRDRVRATSYPAVLGLPSSQCRGYGLGYGMFLRDDESSHDVLLVPFRPLSRWVPVLPGYGKAASMMGAAGLFVFDVTV